ncbi:MAG: tetratricopeptide repeat protein [Nitrospira sp.]|nr:tetratricopeptide repeat protein [Candidatus Manganitrophaceae bacterium]HIL34239.1 tetratricopeptide repeat protein [Candidatus Manganitrophaceae bacterium]
MFWSFILLLNAFSQKGIAKELPQPDPWISLERGVLQLYEQHAPSAPLLNTRSFGMKVTSYIEAGLWSSAERLLENTPDQDADLLRLKLYHKQGRSDLIFDLTLSAPDLFLDQPVWLVAASQGALGRHRYRDTLDLLDLLLPFEDYTPQRLYLTALAYWALKEREAFEQVLNEGVEWSKENSDSPWSDRITLLKVYYHLGKNEIDQAFMSLGGVFDNNADLALLALGWGYFKMNSMSNLYSVLEGFRVNQPKSPYYNRAFRILSRFLIDQGDLQGAIALDQQERIALNLRVESLENETALIRKGIVPSPSALPPGSLLRGTLLRLQEEVGQKKEVTTLLWYVDLQQRKQSLARFKKMEHALQEEQRHLQMEITRRCISLVKTRSRNKAVERLYRQALEAAQDGDQDGVVRSLRDLLDLEPLGPYADESAFRLGDIAFNEKIFPEAISYYQRFLKRPESPLHRLALYKLAWAYYLHGHLEKTVSLLLERRLDPNEGREGVDTQCNIIETPQERREPFRLLALVLQEEKGPAQLFNFVKEKSPEEIFPLYSGLAGFYRSEGNHKDLKRLVSSWIEAYPLYAETPFLQQKVVVSTIQDSNSSVGDMIEARANFVNRYRPGRAWSERNRFEASERISPLLKTHLRFLMTYYYGKGKVQQETAMTRKAATWHRLYLETFPDEEETGATRFLYAELLSELNLDQEAIKAYRTSAYQDPPHRFASEAGKREIVLLERKVSFFEPILLESYGLFVQHFPDDYRVPEIFMKQAEAAYHQGNYEESRSLASKVFLKEERSQCDKTPETACAESLRPVIRNINFDAYRLIAQGYLKENSYDAGIRFLNALFSRFSNQHTLRQLRPLLSLAYYQQGEALKQQGDINQAAHAYWGAYENGPESRLGPLALFEAASLWEGASELFRSEMALNTFHERYPESSLYQPVLMRLGSIYQDSDRLEKAAEVYEKASRLRTSREEARLALAKAMTAYEEMGVWEKVYQLALQGAERPSIQDEQRMALKVKTAEALLQLGQQRGARKILTHLTQQRRGHPPSVENSSRSLSKAFFLLAELKIKDFKAIRLIAPMDLNLQKKQHLFDELLREYSRAAEGPSLRLLFNANHRIGEIFEEFSRALLESERPENLSEEEQQVYEGLLWDQALPYLEKAQETYLQTLALGNESGVENEWTEMSHHRLLFIKRKIDRVYQTRKRMS